MINFELFKSILESSDGYIKPSDYIDRDTVELLSNYRRSKFEPLFTKGNASGSKYVVCTMCPKCSTVVDRTVTKMLLLNIISNKGHLMCDSCTEAQKAEESRQQAEINERQAALRITHTEDYINTYLSPNHSWNKGVKNYVKMRNLSPFNIDWDAIESHILDMDYSDFLSTPYWKAIAEKVRIKANFKCQLCSAQGVLHVHHRDYSFHGRELDNINQLICLCANCHEVHHENV